MSEAKRVHHNPNFLIAVSIIVLTILAAFLISPSIKNSHSSKDDNKVVKTVTIKELGLQLGLNSTLQNLKYVATDTPLGPGAPHRTTVDLSIKEYTDLANKCTGLKSDSLIIKKLIKIDGQAGKTRGSKVLKQLKTYYILSLDSGLPSSEECKKSKVHSQLETLYTKLSNQLDSAVKASSAV